MYSIKPWGLSISPSPHSMSVLIAPDACFVPRQLEILNDSKNRFAFRTFRLLALVKGV